MLYITTACLSLRSYPSSPLSTAILISPLSKWQQHQPTTSVQFTLPSLLLTPTHPQLGQTLPLYAHNIISLSQLLSILIIHNYITNIFSSNIISNITSSISNSYIICKRGNPVLLPYQVVVLVRVLQVLEGDVEQALSA